VCGGKKAMGKPEEKSKKKEMSCHSSEKKRPRAAILRPFRRDNRLYRVMRRCLEG
jgi:hypothetical protein